MLKTSVSPAQIRFERGSTHRLCPCGGRRRQRGLAAWSFVVDTETTLTIDEPLAGRPVNTPVLTVAGRTEPDAPVTLTANGRPAGNVGAPQGRFTFTTVCLVPGANTLTLQAADALSNTAAATLPITFAPTRPSSPPTTTAAATKPPSG